MTVTPILEKILNAAEKAAETGVKVAVAPTISLEAMQDPRIRLLHTRALTV